MNTGQMMLTLGALILLALVVLNINRGFLSTESLLMETKFGVLGVSLATSVVEEANGKAFDDNTDSNAVDYLSQLSSIGPEGEVYPYFNDFDDFDGYVKIIDSIPSAEFKIECKVEYIDPSNPDVPASSNTWHKKLTVTVTTPSSADTIKMSTIYSYFYYR